MGTASLVLSIISLASSFFVIGLPIAIIAIVLAALALNNYEGGAKAIIAIILSVLSIGISQVSLYNIGKTSNTPALASAKTENTTIPSDAAPSSAQASDTAPAGPATSSAAPTFSTDTLVSNDVLGAAAGSLDNIHGNSDSCTWESSNDKDITSNAVLASDDDTKDFTYSDGKISYPVSAFGVTVNNNLIRSDNDYKKYAVTASSSGSTINSDNNQSSEDISNQIQVTETAGDKIVSGNLSFTTYYYEITNDSDSNAYVNIKLDGKNSSGEINASEESGDTFIGKGKTGIVDIDDYTLSPGESASQSFDSPFASINNTYKIYLNDNHY